MKRRTDSAARTAGKGSAIRHHREGVSSGLGAEEEEALLSAIRTLLAPDRPLMIISLWLRRADDGPDPASISACIFSRDMTGERLDDRQVPPDIYTICWKLARGLASRWPAYAAPASLSLVSDGQAVAFRPDLPHLAERDALARALTRPGRWITLAPTGAHPPALLTMIIHSSQDPSHFIQ